MKRTHPRGPVESCTAQSFLQALFPAFSAAAPFHLPISHAFPTGPFFCDLAARHTPAAAVKPPHRMRSSHFSGAVIHRTPYPQAPFSTIYPPAAPPAAAVKLPHRMRRCCFSGTCHTSHAFPTRRPHFRPASGNETRPVAFPQPTQHVLIPRCHTMKPLYKSLHPFARPSAMSYVSARCPAALRNRTPFIRRAAAHKRGAPPCHCPLKPSRVTVFLCKLRRFYATLRRRT